MLKYVAKFTELTHFTDDYEATDMVKVRKFEDGLKLSIRGKIVVLLLQDLDLMVKTITAIKMEVDDARSILDEGDKYKRKESQRSSSSSGKKQRTSTSKCFRDKATAIKAKARINHPKVRHTSGLLAS